MNTIQLECFLAVAEHLNFSRASEVLRITQPAVSHQIQSLEEELDVKLFKRTSKSVSLTQEGIQFLPDAQLILKTALSAKERLGQHEQFIPFELGCHNRMELNLLPPLLKKLTEYFPLLRPVIQIVPFPSLMSQVENNQVHAAFGIKEEHKKSSLYFRELCSAPMACICSPEYPLAQYDSLTKDQPDPIFSIQNSIVAKLRPEQRYFSENMESALTLVKAQIGYTLYPDIIAAREPDLDHPVLRRFLMLCRELGT